MRIVIRKAAAADFEEVFQLFWEFIKSHREYDQRYYALLPRAEFKRQYRKIYARFLKGRTRFQLVAERDGKIMGVIRGGVAKRHPSLRHTEKQGEIAQLMVRVEYRRKGVALALMNEAMARLGKMKMKRVVLKVDAENIPAKRLYSKLDFKDRQVIMTKYL